MDIKCLKFRIYPSKSQITKLNETLDVCRDVYNSFVLDRIVTWETEGLRRSYYDQCKMLPNWKMDNPELKMVYAQVLQNVSRRVDRTFKNYFSLTKRGAKHSFPRFKGAAYDSFTYPQAGYKISSNNIYLNKIGEIKAVFHRDVIGIQKCCTIKRKNGKWFAFITVETAETILIPTGNQIGIDVGIDKMASLSDGSFIESCKFAKKNEKRLSKLCSQMDTAKKGSVKRIKIKKRFASLHEHIGNRRLDYAHKSARYLVNKYDIIAIENLNIQAMRKRPSPVKDADGVYLPNGATAKTGMNKAIKDVAWGQFIRLLKEKAESAGRKVIEVNAMYTSQDCSSCGYRVKKNLSERWHLCPICGCSLDRDTNAAINILKKALGSQCSGGIPPQKPELRFGSEHVMSTDGTTFY